MPLKFNKTLVIANLEAKLDDLHEQAKKSHAGDERIMADYEMRHKAWLDGLAEQKQAQATPATVAIHNWLEGDSRLSLILNLSLTNEPQKPFIQRDQQAAHRIEQLKKALTILRLVDGDTIAIGTRDFALNGLLNLIETEGV